MFLRKVDGKLGAVEYGAAAGNRETGDLADGREGFEIEMIKLRDPLDSSRPCSDRGGGA